MKVFTDSAANLSPEKTSQLDIEVIPFHLTFMGKTYRDGVDLFPEQLYQLYTENPDEYSTTSQPSVGDFATRYDELGEEEILSIHLSSGLSGAYSSAENATHISKNKNVIIIDSRTVGPALGWMVEIAALGVRLSWPKERILSAVEQVKHNTLTMVSFSDVKYLIQSGRVSHLKGLMASLLHIKPIIGMNEEDGRYKTLGQEITNSRAVRKMSEILLARFGEQKIRLQLMHGSNLPGVGQLKEAVTRTMDCVEEKLVSVTTVLGAHAGPTVIGLAAMPEALISSLLGERSAAF
jgi:DegV family protein with EDD domain